MTMSKLSAHVLNEARATLFNHGAWSHVRKQCSWRYGTACRKLKRGMRPELTRASAIGLTSTAAQALVQELYFPRTLAAKLSD